MIGHDGCDARDGLLRERPRHCERERSRPYVIVLSVALLVVGGLALFTDVGGVLLLRAPSSTTAETAKADYWYGATLGGWLVMEINPTQKDGIHPDMRPSWMFDQIEARSELDFVSGLRSEHSDAYAIATMINHWEHYYTDESLDAAQALGVNSVRIPLGYWIMDSPAGGSTPEAYGFSPEGFVTGGLIHLRRMLEKLAARSMTALLDVHAHPCNSACVSNGLACLGPLAFTPDGGVKLYDDEITNEIGDIPKCPIGAGPHGVYPTSRKPTAAATTWGDVGVNAVEALAAWVAGLDADAKRAVAALQLANEPALGPPGIFDAEINRFYKRALRAARTHLPVTPLLMSFMHPLPTVIDFLRSAAADGIELAGGDQGGGRILADHHYYLNWQCPADAPFSWDEIHRRACSLEAELKAHEVDAYGAHGQSIIVGEWSIATNLDAPRDLDDPATVAELRRLYREQLEQFARKPHVVGHFYWTLRMGSGWDPRPTADHPNGRHVDGSSPTRSLPGYPFRVWSLMEMAELGIATRLDASYEGTC